MTKTLRGADIVARTLEKAGMHTIFSLSGNHIMSIYDAAIGTKLELLHVRQEAAAVFMASAWARLTGRVGVALVTGGPGHTNAAAALCTPMASETPMILLSGHAATHEIGRGGFQELPQAAMAATVAKDSWTVGRAADLGHDLARAARNAASGRPGPVHLSLPSDVLDAELADEPPLWPEASAFEPAASPLGEAAASAALSAIAAAERPVIVGGPTLCSGPGRAAARKLEDTLNVPVIGTESPRGLNDPALGAIAEVIRQTDLLVLLGKPLDFTLRFGEAPAFDPACKFIVFDPDVELIRRVARDKGERLILSGVATPSASAAELAALGSACDDGAWHAEVRAAVDYRPPDWETTTANGDGALHALDFCRGVREFMAENPDTVLVCDGGEIGQWSQSMLDSERRIINGVAGSIGSAIPFGLAACTVEREAPVIAISGDGAFGYHLAELDTAIRCDLPLIAVVGNDARWNAEHQIQIRDYGENRVHGCELLPTRYDLVAEALGAHGELVTRPGQLPAALARARTSGKPACINVMIEGNPAPIVRR
ncbi:MAG: thiamine pyrophosphate-binding protein [Alphaproteobacteria bacterium]|nr:thiamine pyrophosphate-binding protein [Alphaproteobacteria bacterium]